MKIPYISNERATITITSKKWVRVRWWRTPVLWAVYGIVGNKRILFIGDERKRTGISFITQTKKES